MRWLLWKDYRHNRLIVFAGLFLLLVPYLIGVWAGLSVIHRHRAPEWATIFAIASIYSLAISQLALAFVGGNAIAGERVDQSAEFLYSLPITRRRHLASKVLVALAIAAVPWLIDTPVFWSLARAGDLVKVRLDWVLTFALIAMTGLVFFCVGWLLSSFIASPTFAVCGGLVTPLILIGGAALADHLFELDISETGEILWYCTSWPILALVCFGVGTWHYLRRVEP
jgi:ABC-type transport system involved in multi-copper enzyme maturation permease subunit